MQAQSRQPQPRQDSVVRYLTEHPGATLNDVFHALRVRDRGVTYETIRNVARKLIAKGLVRKKGENDMYCSPLYLVSSLEQSA